MRRFIAAVAVMLTVGVLSFTAATVAMGKLPKCQVKWCRDIGCPPDVLCSSGATVKSCYDVCHGG